MKKFGKKISGALLALAFVFGIFTATSGTAQAQDRNDGNYQRGHQDGERQDRNRDSSQRRNRDDRYGNNQGDWRRNRDQNRNNGVYGNNGQYGRNRRYDNNGGYNNSNQIALNQGYQAGLNTGASDAQRGQSFSPQRSHYYRDANSQAFRQGFVQGYDQGYRQYSGYGNQRNRTSNNGWGSVLGGILGRP